ncbi:HepT-like ribonuclease domain-containing protein [Rhizobium oryzicola]|uniref:DUF86 domain-containing protein n=1 Tax=Rhizobium oryzicola TaxID=1232668 RepID=A0ABT8T4K3_9HYPH|nr:HepT-like ribonuclease domain-containing protein [Rhizobium oryzicola]MDO1585597.1 DUF86 domain-containing protein [Rhizobium oryzicola]
MDDMLEAIAGIQAAVAGKTLEDYRKEWILRHAVQRGIEIISEASRAIPEDIQQLQPEVPWRSVRGISNVLRHEYHGLSDRIIWGVIVDELLRLKHALEAIFEQVGPGPD